MNETISAGYCLCGCGRRTRLARQTRTAQGVRKGEPMRYVYGHRPPARRGADHPGWKGGRIVDKRGYVSLHAPWHPHATSGGYVLEHRLVVEQNWGNYFLEPDAAQQQQARWARDYDRCVECGTTARKHQGKGLCYLCGNRAWRRARRRQDGRAS